MSGLYPVLLKLEGKRCLVIGNAWGADEKARGLETAGALVTRKPDYRPGDLAGYFLAVAATGDRTLNQRIWQEAEQQGLLFNAVDDPQHCNFVLPAVHRQGDLIVAVSSSGKSPALAVRLRDRFASELGPEHAALLDLLGELRGAVAARFHEFEDRKRAYLRMLDSPALDLLRNGNAAAARAALAAALEAVQG